MVVVALVSASICGMLSTFTSYEMMDKVNAKLRKDDQFDPLGWYLSKTLRLHREYKRLYPSGQLYRRTKLFWVVGCFCLLTCALSLDFVGQ